MDWRRIVARYQQPSALRAVFQLVTTLVPLVLLFALSYRALETSRWIALLISAVMAGFLVRTFIIMHDCGHGSFFRSRRANTIVGWITGVLTLTPFSQWRHDHALHHASSGDLERRGHGDINTLTVREYLALTPGGQLKYRLVRHPLIMFGLGPIHLMLSSRIPPRGDDEGMRRQRISVWSANIAIAALVVGLSLWIGPLALFFVYAPAIYLAAAAGIWLFYVQHQFEDTYWQGHEDWNYADAAMRGSSYLRLPAVLRWFTGSIGLHHVHHLGPRIPNYALVRCHDENPLFHGVTVITLRDSVHTLRLTLWDEARGRLIGFSDLPSAASAA